MSISRLNLATIESLEQKGNLTVEAASELIKNTQNQQVLPLQGPTWDITYLPAKVRGQHYYLYVIEDIYSRKIVGYDVYECESGKLASQLLQQTLIREQCFNQALVLHSDNGAPMKSLTFKAKMEELGIISSYSRPRVSDDNPYMASLFRTVKCLPNWPTKGFESLESSRCWVESFVRWTTPNTVS